MTNGKARDTSQLHTENVFYSSALPYLSTSAYVVLSRDSLSLSLAFSYTIIMLLCIIDKILRISFDKQRT